MTGSRRAWRKTGVLESPAASADVCFLFKARLMCPAHLYRSILKAPFLVHSRFAPAVRTGSNKSMPCIKEVSRQSNSIQFDILCVGVKLQKNKTLNCSSIGVGVQLNCFVMQQKLVKPSDQQINRTVFLFCVDMWASHTKMSVCVCQDDLEKKRTRYVELYMFLYVRLPNCSWQGLPLPVPSILHYSTFAPVVEGYI